MAHYLGKSLGKNLGHFGPTVAIFPCMTWQGPGPGSVMLRQQYLGCCKTGWGIASARASWQQSHEDPLHGRGQVGSHEKRLSRVFFNSNMLTNFKKNVTMKMNVSKQFLLVQSL